MASVFINNSEVNPLAYTWKDVEISECILYPLIRLTERLTMTRLSHAHDSVFKGTLH